MKTPLYCLLTLFQVLSNPLPPSALFIASFLWLNGWSHHRTTSDVLLYLMILWICTCGALVSWYHKDLVCFKQQGIHLLRSNIWHGFCLYSNWYNTNKDTQHTQGLIHPYKYILTPPAMCSQQLSVLFANIKSLPNGVPKCLCFSKITDLYVCWLDSIRLTSSKAAWNTKNTDRYGVNKQNTHHQSLRQR